MGGDGALICGRLSGKESWCNNLEKVARMAHSGDGNYFQNVDAGNSVNAVDQVVIIAAPSDVVRLALIEVSTTFPSVTSDEGAPPDDLALLLKPVVRKGTPSIDFSMVAVSLDATLWNLNEVLQHHMHLRLPPVLETPQENDEANAEERPVLSVLDLFEGLRAAFFPLPPGVVIGQLLEEATKLLDATLVRSDAVTHSTFEKFLQDRMREKTLDSFLALQAVLRRHENYSSFFSLLKHLREEGDKGDNYVEEDPVIDLIETETDLIEPETDLIETEADSIETVEEDTLGETQQWTALIAKHAVLAEQMDTVRKKRRKGVKVQVIGQDQIQQVLNEKSDKKLALEDEN